MIFALFAAGVTLVIASAQKKEQPTRRRSSQQLRDLPH
jgi:hypothetical protein